MKASGVLEYLDWVALGIHYHRDPHTVAGCQARANLAGRPYQRSRESRRL